MMLALIMGLVDCFLVLLPLWGIVNCAIRMQLRFLRAAKGAKGALCEFSHAFILGAPFVGNPFLAYSRTIISPHYFHIAIICGRYLAMPMSWNCPATESIAQNKRVYIHAGYAHAVYSPGMVSTFPLFSLSGLFRWPWWLRVFLPQIPTFSLPHALQPLLTFLLSC